MLFCDFPLWKNRKCSRFEHALMAQWSQYSASHVRPPSTCAEPYAVIKSLSILPLFKWFTEATLIHETQVFERDIAMQNCKVPNNQFNFRQSIAVDSCPFSLREGCWVILFLHQQTWLRHARNQSQCQGTGLEGWAVWRSLVFRFHVSALRQKGLFQGVSKREPHKLIGIEDDGRV